MKTSNRRVKEHFESIASHYNEELPIYYQNYLLERKMSFILHHNHSLNGKKGLDIGCGQGKYLQYLNKNSMKVIGADFSFNNIKNTLSLDLNKFAVNSDGIHLPFKSNIFDFCYCINVLHHLTSREAQQQFVKEMQRIIKVNGKAFIFDLSIKNPLFAYYLENIFPKIRAIDEGDELFFNVEDIKNIISPKFRIISVDYYSFVPDMIPGIFLKFFTKFEQIIEKTFFKKLAMHQVIVLEKVR